jgi:hypothetical protein
MPSNVEKPDGRAARGAEALGDAIASPVLGLERVADADRDLPRDRGLHRARVEHLGAEVRELAGLVVAHRVEHHGLGHAPRIGREHPVDVGPDDDLGGVEEGAEDGPRSRCRCA